MVVNSSNVSRAVSGDRPYRCSKRHTSPKRKSRPTGNGSLFDARNRCRSVEQLEQFLRCFGGGDYAGVLLSRQPGWNHTWSTPIS